MSSKQYLNSEITEAVSKKLFIDTELYPTHVIAKRMKVSPKTVRYWFRMGHLPAYDLNVNDGRPNYRSRGSDINKLLESRLVE